MGNDFSVEAVAVFSILLMTSVILITLFVFGNYLGENRIKDPIEKRCIETDNCFYDGKTKKLRFKSPELEYLITGKK
jgi:hypothetical protein